MWLWDSPKVLLDATARAELFAFCTCQGIDALWMQVALERERAADGTPVLQHAAAWRTLLREAHAAGLTVEALEGAPIYALKTHHAEALAVVDAVIAFSRGAADNDGFDGLHFDIEPHGLYRWRFPEPREALATGLVEVALESSTRLRAAGLRFGVALPHWLQVTDEKTGEPLGVVTWDRTRQSAAYHLIDRLDYVAIMSYRDRTTGPNGVVAIASDLLAHAAAPGRARVYLGLETAADSERVWFVTGEPRERMLARMRARGEDPDELEPIDGFRRSIADDGTRLHLGLRVPTAVDLDAPALLGAMRQLAAATARRRPIRRPASWRQRCRSRSARSTSQATGGGSSRGRSPATGAALVRLPRGRDHPVRHHLRRAGAGRSRARDRRRRAARRQPAGLRRLRPARLRAPPAVPRAARLTRPRPRPQPRRRPRQPPRVPQPWRRGPRRPPRRARPRSPPATRAARSARRRAPAGPRCRQDRRPRLAGQPAADRQQRDHRQRQGDPEDQCEHEQPGQLADDDAERGEHRGAGAANTRAGDVDPREIGEHRRRQRPARDDGDGTGDGKRRHPRAGERDGGGHRADTDRGRRDRPDDQGDAQQRAVEAHAVRGEARGRSAGIDPSSRTAVRARARR
jgi:hypothetical protein